MFFQAYPRASVSHPPRGLAHSLSDHLDAAMLAFLPEGTVMIFPAVCFCKIFSRGKSAEQLVIRLDHGFMILMCNPG